MTHRFKVSSYQSGAGEDWPPVPTLLDLYLHHSSKLETLVPLRGFKVAALQDYVLLFILHSTSHKLHPCAFDLKQP